MRPTRNANGTAVISTVSAASKTAITSSPATAIATTVRRATTATAVPVHRTGLSARRWTGPNERQRRIRTTTRPPRTTTEHEHADRLEHGGGGLVRPHEQQVVRAVLAVLRFSKTSSESGARIAAASQTSRTRLRSSPGRHPAGRERHQHVHERRDPQRAQRQAERERPRGVRAGQRAEEPDEPDHRHQRADAVLRPPPPRVEAGADERPPERERQHDRRPRDVLAVARRHQRERGQPEHEARDGERDERAAEAAHVQTLALAALRVEQHDALLLVGIGAAITPGTTQCAHGRTSIVWDIVTGCSEQKIRYVPGTSSRFL